MNRQSIFSIGLILFVSFNLCLTLPKLNARTALGFGKRENGELKTWFKILEFTCHVVDGGIIYHSERSCINCSFGFISPRTGNWEQINKFIDKHRSLKHRSAFVVYRIESLSLDRTAKLQKRSELFNEKRSDNYRSSFSNWYGKLLF